MNLNNLKEKLLKMGVFKFMKKTLIRSHSIAKLLRKNILLILYTADSWRSLVAQFTYS